MRPAIEWERYKDLAAAKERKHPSVTYGEANRSRDRDTEETAGWAGERSAAAGASEGPPGTVKHSQRRDRERYTATAVSVYRPGRGSDWAIVRFGRRYTVCIPWLAGRGDGRR
jgi:hypothetical protein